MYTYMYIYIYVYIYIYIYINNDVAERVWLNGETCASGASLERPSSSGFSRWLARPTRTLPAGCSFEPTTSDLSRF